MTKKNESLVRLFVPLPRRCSGEECNVVPDTDPNWGICKTCNEGGFPISPEAGGDCVACGYGYSNMEEEHQAWCAPLLASINAGRTLQRDLELSEADVTFLRGIGTALHVPSSIENYKRLDSLRTRGWVQFENGNQFYRLRLTETGSLILKALYGKED